MTIGPAGMIPLIVDPDVPLTRKSDAGDQQVLFWLKFGAVHVHPDRVEEFRQWATDGVLPCALP